MGQYYKGKKIGTCENMYYMTLREAQTLAGMGVQDDDQIPFSDYLKDGVTRFRFPFPNEEGKDLLSLKHDTSFILPVGDVEVNHDRICISNELNGGGHNVNIFIPCLYSKEFKDMGIKTSNAGVGEQMLGVKFQGMRLKEGSTIEFEEKTIFECSRCGQQQRFGSSDIEKIKARATEYYKVYDMTGKNPRYDGDQEKFNNAMKIINLLK